MANMSVLELEDFIGRAGLLQVEGLKFPVIVDDAKRAYGVLRFKVRPADSRDLGSQWVAAHRVELDEM